MPSLFSLPFEQFSSLDEAMALAIFKAVDLSDPPTSAAKACELVSAKMGGRPIFLVLDEIDKLGDYSFEREIRYYPKGNRHIQAIGGLRNVIDQLFNATPRNMIFLTGRFGWKSVHVLGPESPLRASPVFLHPLQSDDVLEIMHKVPRFRGSDNPEVQAYLAEAIAKRSGGVGGVVMEALDRVWASSLASSVGEANKILEKVEDEVVEPSHGIGPYTRERMNGAELCDPALLSVVLRMLIFETPFRQFDEVTLNMTSGTRTELITSVLTFAGFNFVPMQDDPSWLVPVANDWHLRNAQQFARYGISPLISLFQLVKLLKLKRGGSKTGKVFESYCIHQLTQRSQLPDDKQFPFLQGTAAGRVSLGTTFRPHMLPVVTLNASKLSKEQEADRDLVMSLEAIHPSDLRYLLHKALRYDEVGVSGSGCDSYNCFVRGWGATMGFSIKTEKALELDDILQEIQKRPSVWKGDDPFVSVFLAPVLGSRLQELMGNDRSALLLSKEEARALRKSSNATAPSNADVVRDIVVVSPTHKDGLPSLLTESVCKDMRDLALGKVSEESVLKGIIDAVASLPFRAYK